MKKHNVKFHVAYLSCCSQFYIVRSESFYIKDLNNIDIQKENFINNLRKENIALDENSQLILQHQKGINTNIDYLEKSYDDKVFEVYYIDNIEDAKEIILISKNLYKKKNSLNYQLGQNTENRKLTYVDLFYPMFLNGYTFDSNMIIENGIQKVFEDNRIRLEPMFFVDELIEA